MHTHQKQRRDRELIRTSYAVERSWLKHSLGAVEIALYGSQFGSYKEVNWSLAPLQNKGDEQKREAQELCWRLSTLGWAYETKKILAPNPTKFNGKIASREELEEKIILSPRVTLFRGAYADGVEIMQGESYAISTGGCPIITALRGNRVVAAHAGLESLFTIKEPDRPSVVDEIVKTLGYPTTIEEEALEVRIDFTIPPYVFTHPIHDTEYGEKNRALCSMLTERWGKKALWGDNVEMGCIDLQHLIREQFKKYPLAHVEMGMYLPPDIELAGKRQVVAYHTRQQEPYRNRRNLAFVARSG